MAHPPAVADFARWPQYMDAAGRQYLADPLTGKTRWLWELRTDLRSGNQYFANIVTGETRWVNREMVAAAGAASSPNRQAAGQPAGQTQSLSAANSHPSYQAAHPAYRAPQQASARHPRAAQDTAPPPGLQRAHPGPSSGAPKVRERPRPAGTPADSGPRWGRAEGPFRPQDPARSMGAFASRSAAPSPAHAAASVAPGPGPGPTPVRRSKVEEATAQKEAVVKLQCVVRGFSVRNTKLYSRLRLLLRKTREVDLLNGSQADGTGENASGNVLLKSLDGVERALPDTLATKDLARLQLLKKSLIGIGEMLTQAMIAVDGVESDGDERIRQARKSVIKRIQIIEARETSLKARLDEAITGLK